MDNIIVRIVRLPAHIKGCVVPDSNGDYNIYLSDCLDEVSRLRTLRHELKHIENGDIHSHELATVIEKRMKEG